ncbi:hypothetical protein K402DRAFT_397345 [Aulographum hederae CBS 113979]|uniref:Extracellular mutant protein 11 C-terminal domain-containing protein n=1 Tax=Aulographum hederae CBS 113979 TaxID=1176131 RepID=A0A6G1GNW9_9PEZI|nr:hypothetical protein K402DRAFT_397345 [Aulographum hederae CBS 113979]
MAGISSKMSDFIQERVDGHRNRQPPAQQPRNRPAEANARKVLAQHSKLKTTTRLTHSNAAQQTRGNQREPSAEDMPPPRYAALQGRQAERPESARDDNFGTDIEGYTEATVPSIIQVEDSQLDEDGNPVPLDGGYLNEETEEDFLGRVTHASQEIMNHPAPRLNNATGDLRGSVFGDGQSYPTTSDGQYTNQHANQDEEEGSEDSYETEVDEDVDEGEEVSVTPKKNQNRTLQRAQQPLDYDAANSPTRQHFPQNQSSNHQRRDGPATTLPTPQSQPFWGHPHTGHYKHASTHATPGQNGIQNQSGHQTNIPIHTQSGSRRIQPTQGGFAEPVGLTRNPAPLADQQDARVQCGASGDRRDEPRDLSQTVPRQQHGLGNQAALPSVTTNTATPVAANPVENGSLNEEMLDYPAAKIKQLEFSQLQMQSFDVDPTSGDPVLPKEVQNAPLADRLEHARTLPNFEHQKKFFAQLPLEEWEDAGNWFLGKFGEIVAQLSTARKEKRKFAAKFESELSKRHNRVEKRKVTLEDTISSMQSSGQQVLQKAETPRKKKR